MSDMERFMPLYRKRSGPEKVDNFFGDMQGMFQQIMSIREAMQNRQYRSDMLDMESKKAETDRRYKQHLREIDQRRFGEVELPAASQKLEHDKRMSVFLVAEKKWTGKLLEHQTKGIMIKNKIETVALHVAKMDKADSLVKSVNTKFGKLISTVEESYKAAEKLNITFQDQGTASWNRILNNGTKEEIMVPEQPGTGTGQAGPGGVISNELVMGSDLTSDKMNKLAEQYGNLGIISEYDKTDLYDLTSRLIHDDMIKNPGYNWLRNGSEQNNERIVNLLFEHSQFHEKSKNANVDAWNNRTDADKKAGRHPRTSKWLTGADIGGQLGKDLISHARAGVARSDYLRKLKNYNIMTDQLNQYMGELNVRLANELPKNPDDWTAKMANDIYVDFINELAERKGVPDFIKRDVMRAQGEIKVDLDIKTGKVTGRPTPKGRVEFDDLQGGITPATMRFAPGKTNPPGYYGSTPTNSPAMFGQDLMQALLSTASETPGSTEGMRGGSLLAPDVQMLFQMLAGGSAEPWSEDKAARIRKQQELKARVFGD